MSSEYSFKVESLTPLQIWAKFRQFNEKRKSLKGNLPESELFELTDKICLDDQTWEG